MSLDNFVVLYQQPEKALLSDCSSEAAGAEELAYPLDTHEDRENENEDDDEEDEEETEDEDGMFPPDLDLGAYVAGRQTFFRCDACDLVMFEANKANHLRGKRHRANVLHKGISTDYAALDLFHCETCRRTMPLKDRWLHESGKLHERKLKSGHSDVFHCETCNSYMPEKDRIPHLSGKMHKGRITILENPEEATERMRELRKLRKERRATRGGCHHCEECGTTTTTSLAEHLASERHAQGKVVRDGVAMFYCEECDIELPEDERLEHIDEPFHLENLGIDPAPSPFYCEICDRTMPAHDKELHIKGRMHKRKESPRPQKSRATKEEKRTVMLQKARSRGKHPNGKRRIAVEEVQPVYKNPVLIPMQAYRDAGVAQSGKDLITVAQLIRVEQQVQRQQDLGDTGGALRVNRSHSHSLTETSQSQVSTCGMTPSQHSSSGAAPCTPLQVMQSLQPTTFLIPSATQTVACGGELHPPPTYRVVAMPPQFQQPQFQQVQMPSMQAPLLMSSPYVQAVPFTCAPGSLQVPQMFTQQPFTL